MATIHVVVGGQFGSEAKGHVTDYLVRNNPNIGAVVRVAGPNAGHTAYDDNGQAHALRQIPCAAVSRHDVDLYIAPGSEIDPRVLDDEYYALQRDGFVVDERLTIDGEATVIEAEHLQTEGDLNLANTTGSTGKGIGAARADRLLRRARTWKQYQSASDLQWGAVGNVPYLLRKSLELGQDVLVEGTQGYGLGLHAGYYPHCTSSDCRAVDFLAMAGLSPWMPRVTLKVWIVYRTYPIRIAGPSGPMYRELDWAELSERTGGYIKPEYTTVTKKLRRIGEWDPGLAKQAMLANGGPAPEVKPVLTFFDYLYPEAAGWTKHSQMNEEMWETIYRFEAELGTAPCMLGTGPSTMIDLHL